jgi:6-bladed beta-propeller protein
MVQLLLNRRCARSWNTARATLVILALALPTWAAKPAPKQAEAAPPDLLLQGGRKLSYERSFGTEREVRTKRGFFNKVLDVVAGEPEWHALVRPYDIAMDSHGRFIITDPGAKGIHIFDFAQGKYKFIERNEEHRDPLRAPQCVAVDAHDNIYVTDSQAGKIFVFDSGGKFQRAIGSLRGGEGFFKRPTGIALDSKANQIYVTDTLRNQVFVLDMKGMVVKTIGKNGTDLGQFNFPTELLLSGNDLAVVDAMNFRVQVFDRDGNFEYAIGKLGDSSGTMFRPKGIGFDSEGHLYVVDGLYSTVQVFDREGHLLYYFGMNGTAPGEFQLPSGLLVSKDDRIYVVDSFNRRVQIFHYFAADKQAKGGGQ